MDGLLIAQATKLIKAMDKTVDNNLPNEIAEIVKFHAKAASVSALAAAWVPGVGSPGVALASAGIIWSMYGRIGAKIDLPFSQNILKSLASGMAINLAAGYLSSMAFATTISFIPILGGIGASAIMGATCYALTVASGYVYLKTMTMLFSQGIDPTSLNEEELKQQAKTASNEDDVGEVIKEAKQEFKFKKAAGDFD